MTYQIEMRRHYFAPKKDTKQALPAEDGGLLTFATLALAQAHCDYLNSLPCETSWGESSGPSYWPKKVR